MVKSFGSKLCLYSIPFPHVKSYYDMIDIAAQYGIGAVEGFSMFELETPDADAAARIREYALNKGVVFPCFSVYAMLAADSSTKEMLKKYAYVAKILGSPYIHHTIVGECSDFNKVLPEKEKYFREGVEAVREIYDYAQSIGIKAIYEQQGYIFNGIGGFGRFLDEVNRDVGVVADFGNCYMADENLSGFLKAYADRVVHVHIKDVALKSTNPDGTGLPTLCGKYMFPELHIGKGCVNLKEATDILKKSGYNGYYALEFGADDDNSNLIIESIDMLGNLI